MSKRSTGYSGCLEIVDVFTHRDLIGNLEEHDQQPDMRHTAKMVKLVAFAKSETFGL